RWERPSVCRTSWWSLVDNGVSPGSRNRPWYCLCTLHQRVLWLGRDEAEQLLVDLLGAVEELGCVLRKGTADGVDFQQPPQPIQVVELVEVDARDDHALAGARHHQGFRLQLPQRLPDRDVADTEPLDEVAHDDRGPGCERPREDLAAQPVSHLLGEADRLDLVVVGRHSFHLSLRERTRRGPGWSGPLSRTMSSDLIVDLAARHSALGAF